MATRLRPGLTVAKKSNYSRGFLDGIFNQFKPASRVDVVSRSTAGGGSGLSFISLDGESGGSLNQVAKLIYKYDMVANAVILEKLGYQNENAKRLLDAWEGTSKEVAILESNPNRKVVWDKYLTYVQDNRLNKMTYHTFMDYYVDPDVELSNHGHNQMKYMMPCGLGRPIFSMSQIFESKDKISKDRDGLKKVPTNISSRLDNVRVRESVSLPLNDWTNNIQYIGIGGKALRPNVDYCKDYSNSSLTIDGKISDTAGSKTLIIKLRHQTQSTLD